MIGHLPADIANPCRAGSYGSRLVIVGQLFRPLLDALAWDRGLEGGGQPGFQLDAVDVYLVEELGDQLCGAAFEALT